MLSGDIALTYGDCFNPRPPLLAGDAVHQFWDERRRVVSIRARHCWRAMLVRVAEGAGATPVSIRARHCWRAMPRRRPHRHARPAVSIRARHCWRAMPAAAVRWVGRAQFQSAPAIAGGRCLRPPPRTASGRRFNPRPPLLAGDALARLVVLRSCGVSIRARHCWRAMRPPVVQRGRRSTCFNPRPPLLAGDAPGLRPGWR